MWLVLIESDWNLKDESAGSAAADQSSINRIRLEFKEKYIIYPLHSVFGINRIRLEFKAVLAVAVACFAAAY